MNKLLIDQAVKQASKLLGPSLRAALLPARGAGLLGVVGWLAAGAAVGGVAVAVASSPQARQKLATTIKRLGASMGRDTATEEEAAGDHAVADAPSKPKRGNGQRATA